ncbi:DUF6364 family protein [Kibdelosporangium phytohabitans]|uniref:CopG family transcriptional regulator n=1 Tax=Kibdelosporangium phytohabitans TaxID=860235 RepID=A0A0N9HPP5_9PSEU|nr:DUF6364 family protein [Kibdelosporangium phytohabitans]ALG06650.1 hypothetical protein AOZ06_06680 [Kibdelosporangium phytohabitans]MBE1467862.1 hypothetical protein [Kibdelosporangium phytohabitans]
MKRNITVQLDEEVIAKAKVLAARRGTSVSALLSQEVTKLTEEVTRYEAARHRALAMMEELSKRRRPGEGETITWTREEIHGDRGWNRKGAEETTE